MNLERERGVFMLTNETIALMEELTQAVGISGDERNISKIMKTHMEPYADEIIYDNLGFYLRRKEKRKTECIKSDDLRSYG